MIKRCIELWTNPDDIVLDPFDGIGSTTYTAVRMGRRAIGIELKGSYYNQAVANTAIALNQDRIPDMDGERDEAEERRNSERFAQMSMADMMEASNG